MNNLGDRLYSLRKSNSLTQEAFAAALNERYDLKINKSMVSKWENNIDTPSLNSAKYIAIFFDVSLDFLLGVSDDKNVVAVDVPTPADPLQLTEQEERLVAICRSLNDEGRERLAEYGDDLVASGKYIKRTSEYRPVSPIPEKKRAVEDAYKKVLKNVNAKEVEYDDI